MSAKMNIRIFEHYFKKKLPYTCIISTGNYLYFLFRVFILVDRDIINLSIKKKVRALLWK